MKPTWTKGISWTLTLTGPFDSYNYDWELIDATKHMSVSTDTLYIRVYYSDQLLGYELEKITVTFKDLSQIVDSKNGYELVDTGFDLYLEGKEYEIKQSQTVGLWLFVFLYCSVIAIALFNMLLGFSGWIAFDMIAALQMLHLIPM